MDGITGPKAHWQPLAIKRVKLGDFVPVGVGPKGNRLVVNVVSAVLTSEKVNAALATDDAADWDIPATISEGGLVALDVRFPLKTDDGAFIYVEYQGRGEMATGTIAVAPTFQTGSEKYKWLNRTQAVGAGNVNLETGDLVDQLYEVKVSV
jgi:Protein of unknown function (DUF3237)